MEYRILTALVNLKTTAEGCSSDFAQGYRMAIGHAIELVGHAIELAEVIQFRIDHNLDQEGK